MKDKLHPDHYTKGIEPIDFIESWDLSFSRGNIIKYVARAGHKDDEILDLKKAKYYLDREIDKLENKRMLLRGSTANLEVVKMDKSSLSAIEKFNETLEDMLNESR